MIDRTFDAETGIIRVKAVGEWTVDEIDDHFARLRLIIKDLRARSIPIRVLVDVRHAPERSPLIESRIAQKKTATYRSGDRVAILTRDTNDKDHVRTFLDGADFWAWQSEMAAEQWLLLDREQLRVSPQRTPGGKLAKVGTNALRR